jgi:hypothetical protein
VDAAPRFSDQLWKAIARLDDGTMPYAEVYRRLGALADELGLSRPSYETVRRFVHDHRRWSGGPTLAGVALDVAFRAKPPTAILDHLSDNAPPPTLK